ncbi:MAG TPA: hypothetical protein VNA30_03980 [Mycobacteriales bacterium]|nr:hypothetical protein [Mycobacteriales bacterium]
MTDPFAGLRTPLRALPVGGDVRAIASGRRALHRRRAAYGVVCGAGALAVVMVVALVSTEARQDSLDLLPPAATPTSQASETPSPSPVPGLPSGAPTALSLPRLPGSSPEPSPAESESAAPSAAPAGPYVGPEPTTADGGAVMTRTASSDPAFCSAGAQQQVSVYSDGWCSAVSGPGQVVAGQRVSYSYKLCRNVAKGAGRLTFATAKEVDFTAQQHVSAGTEIVWQAGAAAELPPSPHTVDVEAGNCLTWTTTWSGQNNAGYALPEDGEYEIDAYGYADEWVGEDADFPPPVAFTPVSVSWN